MPKDQSEDRPRIVAGVNTHKDLHFAAIADAHDRVIANESFAITRQVYKKMLTWMLSCGAIDRVGNECTGTYGAGLLRYHRRSRAETKPRGTFPSEIPCRSVDALHETAGATPHGAGLRPTDRRGPRAYHHHEQLYRARHTPHENRGINVSGERGGPFSDGFVHQIPCIRLISA